MGKHSQIATDKVVVQPFIWPPLPRAQSIPDGIDGLPPAVVDIGDLRIGQVALKLRGPISVPPHSLVHLTRLRIGDEILEIASSENLLELALDANNHAADIAEYAREVHAIVLEHLAEPLIKALSDQLGVRDVQVLDHKRIDAPHSGPSIGLKAIGFRDVEVRMQLSGPTKLLRQVAALLNPAIEETKTVCLDHVTTAAVLFAPDIEINQPALREIADGDALLLERSWFAPEKFSLQLAGGPRADVLLEDNSLRLRAPFQPQRRISQMSKAPMPDDAVTDTPVTISVELARKEVALGDVIGLAAGAIVPFETDDLTKVVLTANGHRIANGELVNVDDQIAIRLTDVS
ncbi:MAG: FliM/FliN family flagellar motor switch protein [Pseudomonadota bacterium]